MENKCHHHVKESRTFLQSLSKGCFNGHPKGRCLTEKRREFVFGYSPQMIVARVVRMRYLGNM